MENNKKDRTSYNANGKAHGEWVRYYGDGQLEHKGSYNNGEQHGYWVEYFRDGQLYYKGEYNNGNKVGMWKQWNLDTGEYDNIFYG